MQGQKKRPRFSKWYRRNIRPKTNCRAETSSAERQVINAGIYDSKRLEDRGKVKSAYNATAPIYEKVIGLGYMRWGNDFLFQEARFKGNDNVLSIGSGIGAVEAYIAKYMVKKGNIIGLDIAEKMGQRQKELASKMQIKNVKTITGSAEEIPLPSNSQDIVIMRSVTLVPETVFLKAVLEIKRVLKQSWESKAIIIGGGTKKEIEKEEQAYKAAGFEIAKKIVRDYGGTLCVCFLLKLKM